MSESALLQAQVKRLARTALTSPSASVRKEALLEIRKLDHPDVTALLQQVSAEDKDAEVRNLAQNLLRKREIDHMVEAGTVDTPATADPFASLTYQDEAAAPSLSDLLGSTKSDSENTWVCRFCGTPNTGGNYCDSCGAHRAATDQPIETPRTFKPRSQPLTDANEVFLLQSNHRRFIIGDSRRLHTTLGTMSFGCGFLFMIPFILAGFLVIFLMAQEWHHNNLLNTTGQVIRGEYTGNHVVEDDDDGGITYYADYVYTVDDVVYVGDQSVDYDLYRRVERGMNVDVEYVPSDPAISRLAGTDDAGEIIFLGIFSVIWNGVTWGIVGAFLYSYGRDRILARDGQLVRGELVSIRRKTDSDNDTMLHAEYRFSAPDSGEVIVSKQKQQRNDMRRKPLPDAGTPVAVLYKNPNHFKML
ncbi:MAG: hypothetical protein CL610_14415 [Anaerolineaceae bacterium]|nr:hypothetical protein [Anaerolineaceae bacterium]